MAVMRASLEIYFAPSPEQKGQFTRNMVGSIWVTLRSLSPSLLFLKSNTA